MPKLAGEERIQLKAIRSRLEATTDGPWPESCQRLEIVRRWLRRTGAQRPDADVAFVAHARSDVPWLLDLIDRITEEGSHAHGG